jgi:hypothetical protein
MNARTLPETANRRAVLRSILALGAIGAAPIAAGSALAASDPAGLDAGLFALIDEAREAQARVEAAEAALAIAMERTEKVPPPQALIATEDDLHFWKLNVGDAFTGSYIDVMRQRRAGRAPRQKSEYLSRLSAIGADATLSEKDRAFFQLLLAGEVREDQLIAAMDQWKAARHEAKVRSGEQQANQRLDEILGEQYEACERVARMRARTLHGVLAKLAFIASDFDEESDLELTAEMGTSELILFSVAVDFKALAPGVAV